MSTTPQPRHVSFDDKSMVSAKGTISQEDALPIHNWYPCAPSGTQRYDLNRTVEDKQSARIIPPLTISFSTEARPPLGWEKHIHPQGLPYFVLSLPDGGRMRRIVTEEWMHDPDISTLIGDFIVQIQDAISNQNISLLPESDLFVQLERKEGKLTKDDSRVRCGYYFVHHERRCIYWLGGFELNPAVSLPLRNIRGDLTGYQTQLCLEVEYWMHWSLFPTLHSVTPNIHDHIIETITNVSTDVISCENASTVFTYETLKQMLKVVQIAKDSRRSSWYSGHFMYQLVNDQLRNCSSAWGTRLDSGESVIRKAPRPQSLLLDMISPFLFFTPHARLERLEAVIIDGFVTLPRWEQFIDRLQEERKETAMIAMGTILVNLISRVGPLFLSRKVEGYGQCLHTASYMSLNMSVFGALLSLLICRDQQFTRLHHWHRTVEQVYANVYATSAGEPDYRKLDLLILIWSVPHALVLWSATLLSAAWLSFCFIDTNTTTRIILGMHLSVFSSLTLYYLVKFKFVSKGLAIWLRRVIEYWRVARGGKSREAME